MFGGSPPPHKKMAVVAVAGAIENFECTSIMLHRILKVIKTILGHNGAF